MRCNEYKYLAYLEGVYKTNYFYRQLETSKFVQKTLQSSVRFSDIGKQDAVTGHKRLGIKLKH